jgi:hypothetical protein
MRCPFYQQDGRYVQVADLLASTIFIDTRLIPHIKQVQEDFEVVGNYRWSCALWPSVHEMGYECILQDKSGNKFTVDEVIGRYLQTPGRMMILQDR